MNRDIIESYIRSLRPILHIQSNEFRTVCAEILENCPGMRFCAYMHGLGAINPKTHAIDKRTSLHEFLDSVLDMGYDTPSCIILLDVHEDQLQSPEIVSRLNYVAERTLYTEGYQATVFLVSARALIPQGLEHLITLVPKDSPKQARIEEFLRDYAHKLEFEIADKDVGELALELKGLSLFQIKRILDLAYTDGGVVTREDRRLILQEKKQIIQKSGLLEYIDTSSQLSSVGGLEFLKEWLERKGRVMERLDEALKSGVDIPKGILIVGFPGCGKSLVAKTTATQFRLPLLRLDVGRILGKYVGESEQRMRMAFAQAEAVSPCVLWVDEVEKAFAGGGSSAGHEVTVRLIGQFLTWMQEKDSTVFVVATANDLDRLPTEFLRKGRFDEIFSVGLPNKQERYQILKIHLQQRGKYIPTMNLAQAVDATDGFSGADIEAAVNKAIEEIFLANSSRLNVETLITAINQITPLSKALKKKFSDMSSKLDEYSVQPASMSQ